MARIMHFTDTAWFEPIVPPILGSARFWVLASGVAEVTVGICLILPKTRKKAGYASAALLVALYPANLYMWIFDVRITISYWSRDQADSTNRWNFTEPLDSRIL